MGDSGDPVGTLDVALAHTRRLLETDPALAAEQAAEILRAVPDQPVALLLLGVARRAGGDAAAALAVHEPLAGRQPDWAAAHYELGLTRGAARQGEAAVAALRRAVSLQPDLAEAWRALADHLAAIGDGPAADDAFARYLKFSVQDPRLLEAASALCDNRIAAAEALLREHLRQHPTDVAAIRMLAEVAARLGRYGDSENLLARCLELAPGFTAARYNYALVLHRQGKVEALDEIERVLAVDPHNPGYRNLQAAILIRIGEFDRAIAIYETVLAEYPNQPKAWMSLGHALKSAGRQPECVAAYRRSIGLAPGFGEAYWSLANLKTFGFSPAELDTMRSQLDRPGLTNDDRLHLHFAIGKALEDAGEYAGSFEHYVTGNRLRRATTGYDPDETTSHTQRCKELFSREFFSQRSGWGSAAPDPIFIVGLPRSGSTLLEQVLSSHSAVEGTMELPDVISIARALGGRKIRAETSRYPEVLATLGAAECRALGEQYLERTRIQRKTGAPLFIDKMPNNFAHVGLIHLMLPAAKIIDARRHPLGCCFSAFKQHFARGQNFTYDLQELGRYYRDYVELMAHFDAVLPGRVHRVIYETFVEDTEAELRRLLAYCGLPFEAGCLRFYENERVVRTASSEQVRQPIYRDAMDHWRHYEPWLDPLKRALGPALETALSPPDDCSAADEA